MSKRINITLPDTVLEDLERWAKSQGRSTANLAAFLIEMSIEKAKDLGEFSFELKSQGEDNHISSPTIAKSKISQSKTRNITRSPKK